MSIIGCDLHTRYQVEPFGDEETGEIQVRRREHVTGEVKSFYVQFARGDGGGSGSDVSCAVVRAGAERVWT
jgi:hypothetical protein